MWNSRLFWKLFAGFSLASATLVLLASLTAFAQSRTSANRHEQSQLQLTAELLAAGLAVPESGTGRQDISQESQQLRLAWLRHETKRSQLAALRVTVLDRHGRLIWDSDSLSVTADSISRDDARSSLAAVSVAEGEITVQPEPANAVSGDRYLPEFGGIFETKEREFGIPRPVYYRDGFAYCAAPIWRASQLRGALRIAAPVRSLAEPGTPFYRWLFAGTLLALALAAAIGWWAARQISEPVMRLSFAADELARGDYGRPIYFASKSELGNLAIAFNRMRLGMQKREDELRESNQRLGTVLGAMTDGVIAIGPSESVVFANAAAGKLMRFNHLQAQGRSLLETVRNHTLHSLVSELLITPGQRRCEIEAGDAGDVSLSVTATSLPGDPATGVVLVFNNLTELRRIEAMRRDFVANVSHELKTPLSAIKAYAETLSNGAIDDPANRMRFVQQIEEQSERLNQLIKDLLSLARIESGKQFFTISPQSVRRMIEGCFRDQRIAADAKGLAMRLDAQLPDLMVKADEDAMRQIFVNLIDNAIKYTHEGAVTVDWSVAPGGMIAIRVCDTGIGIPAEMQSRVFERFFRVDRARSREVGGTGLGLSIVKHLTQSLGGTVLVASNGAGTSFTICLPSAQESAS